MRLRGFRNFPGQSLRGDQKKAFSKPRFCLHLASGCPAILREIKSRGGSSTHAVLARRIKLGWVRLAVVLCATVFTDFVRSRINLGSVASFVVEAKICVEE